MIVTLPESPKGAVDRPPRSSVTTEFSSEPPPPLNEVNTSSTFEDVSITRDRVEDACSHLRALCDEMAQLITKQLKPGEHVRLVPGIVVAASTETLEVSTPVVCVFRGSTVSGDVVTHELQSLWTEKTLRDRIHAIRKSFNAAFLTNTKDWASLDALLEGLTQDSQWTQAETLISTSAGSFLSPATVTIRELRNENASLHAELATYQEALERLSAYSHLKIPDAGIEPGTSNTASLTPVNEIDAAEIASLRRRSLNQEKKWAAEKSAMADRMKRLKELEELLVARETEVARRERLNAVEAERLARRSSYVSKKSGSQFPSAATPRTFSAQVSPREYVQQVAVSQSAPPLQVAPLVTQSAVPAPNSQPAVSADTPSEAKLAKRPSFFNRLFGSKQSDGSSFLPPSQPSAIKGEDYYRPSQKAPAWH